MTSNKENKKSIIGVLVDPFRRTMEGSEVFIEDGVIVRIESRPEVNSPFILPGFVDAHVHIESSMLVPSRFAQMAVKHGTVAVVTDPHEVANVAGEKGIRFMIEDGKSVPLNFFFGVPSCVPASPLEKSGAVLSASEVLPLLAEPEFYFLAEMMNFPGVIYDDVDVHEKIQGALILRKPVDGHAPGLTGEGLKKYADSGITTDHECSTIEEAIEKIKVGIKVQIREGSAAKNFNNLSPLINNYHKSVMFCTDDCHPDYLEKGHINKIVARAVKGGYNIFDVLSIASINPIKHYNLPLGFLQLDQRADMAVVNNLEDFDVIETLINGETVYSKGEVKFLLSDAKPQEFNFRKGYNREDLKVKCEGNTINIIEAIEGELITNWLVEKSPVPMGDYVNANTTSDFLKIVLLDRYSEAKPVIAFIKGFGMKSGAIAASIAHDSHHILAIGCDDKSIAEALDWILYNRGGICFSDNGIVEGIALPFFGLMTNEIGENVSSLYKLLNDKVKQTGCKLASPFMTASFMALTVIPKLKIFHNGLFDGSNFKAVSLFPD
jgi:adenine deaminase